MSVPIYRRRRACRDVAAPLETVSIGKCTVMVLGTVPGYGPDGERITEAAASFGPDAIALGVPEEDLVSLDALVADPTLADGMEPDGLDLYFLQLVAEWGQTQILPSPDLHAAHATGIPLHGIDLDDDAHTQLFTDTVKVRHLVQRTGIRRRLGKSVTEDYTDPYHLACQWDEALQSIKPLAGLERAREDEMVRQIRDLAANNQRILAVVHAARFDGVVERLSHPS